MKILLYAEKTVEENASIYFEKAKKLARKVGGAKEALREHQQKLAQLKKKEEKELEKRAIR